LTRNGVERLPSVLANVALFADEIVVGVDDSSTDETLAFARSHADVVFRFEHSGLFDGARMHFFEVASGDWILSLDDDEAMDGTFVDIVAELLAGDAYTHYYFPRKWVVHRDASKLQYARAMPWFPDWQPRMVRNDRRLVFHPASAHSGFRVVGSPCYETRTSILHFEHVLLTEEERGRKVFDRRDRAGGWEYEEYYASIPPSVLADAPAPTPPNGDAAPSKRRARAVEGVILAPTDVLPPWRATLRVALPDRVRPGETTFATVTAENTGALRWVPPGDLWPRLYFSYHLFDVQGKVVLWDGDRTPVGRIVDPGDDAEFLVLFRAPESPGTYDVEWDMVSEGECWFAETGSLPIRTTLVVGPDHARRPSSDRKLQS
jgi:hypothetical protein